MSLTASLMMTLYALDNTTNSFSACSVSAAAGGAPWPDAAGVRFASVSVSTSERWDTARHRLRRWECLETEYLEVKTMSLWRTRRGNATPETAGRRRGEEKVLRAG